jgi:hypothetical protein
VNFLCAQLAASEAGFSSAIRITASLSETGFYPIWEHHYFPFLTGNFKTTLYIFTHPLPEVSLLNSFNPTMAES